MAMGWQGRRVLLTGAAGGLGPAIGAAVVDQGAILGLTARTARELDEAVALIGHPGALRILAPGDLTSDRFRAELIDEAVGAMGGVDILINCAGVEVNGHFERTPPGVIELSLAVNLEAAMDLTRRVLPGMLQARAGHIVNLASLAGVGTPPYLAVYSATKAGLIGFTRSIRSEYRARGVSATAICPGFVRGGGMYQRKQDAMPVRTPRLLGTTTREQVAATVIRSVRQDLAEPIVNPGPARLAAAVVNAFPGLAGALSRFAGSTGLLREWADRLEKQ